MTRRRRAALLLGLALLLGTLAASDVGRREAALRKAVGPGVPVVVARGDLRAGDALTPSRLAVRRVPARYVPEGAFAAPAALAGTRAAGAITAGTDLVPALVDDGTRAGAPVAAGERVAELVARGAPELVKAGGRVDVLVTRERDGGAGETRLALEDVEVLTARPAPEDGREGGPRVAVALRTTLRQAVYLAAAESFAREIRLLPRAAGDDRRGAQGTAVDSALR
ncbi:SAF domain-containing protein [Conexibacter sp. SYSU D00693]|uniref:SAF domain-containing protein n=1 Tax=Conexibacter sp. SYSU D00693 TaxID=2812560 RepID=UPI00196AF951|nr:SAF domain-containing protein [Conexibacter sp. SYSU D00693]